MIEIFNIKTTKFKIENFIINEPLTIYTLDGRNLSCLEKKNIIFFNIFNDYSIKQKWIIERDPIDENIFYIKSTIERYNYTQYLGCPNKDDRVYLYTSKNKYTRWSILNINDNIYEIKYIGEKFNTQEVCLVIARYNEDIEWVNSYKDIAIVYNKGPNFISSLKNIIKIENIGREGHTYLYHIIKNYKNLNKKTIFCQGGPFEHNETLLFGIDNYYKTLDVQPLGLQYLKEENIPPIQLLKKYKNITDYGLKYLVVNVNEDHDYCNDYFFPDFGVNNIITKYKEKFPECKSLVENFLIRSNFPIVKQINKIRYTWSGLFSVTSDKIQKYDVTVYQGLINELISFNPQGGENGYILERLWLYIFED
jgi:hypothetical protein